MYARTAITSSPGMMQKPGPDITALANRLFPHYSRPARYRIPCWSGAGEPGTSILLSRQHWQTDLFRKQNIYTSFEDFWNHSLQDGVFEVPSDTGRQPEPGHEGLKEIMDATGISGSSDDIELQVYESVGLGTGKQANNPWLMELPDPVTKLTWDNVAAISPALAAKLGLITGDVVRIDDAVELPVLVQVGQADNTVSVAAGYGRTVSGKVASGVGANAYPLLRGEPKTFVRSVSIEKTGMVNELALTQEHHSMEGRAIVRETSLEEYREDAHAGNELHQHVEEHHTTLYEETRF